LDQPEGIQGVGSDLMKARHPEILTRAIIFLFFTTKGNHLSMMPLIKSFERSYAFNAIVICNNLFYFYEHVNQLTPEVPVHGEQLLALPALDVISNFQNVWFESLDDKDMYVKEETDKS
jgi:hypothetical protein